MDWREFAFAHRFRSVIVGEFNVECVTISPPETEAPLPVDADAVLSRAIASQLLQSIPRRNPQLSQLSNRLEELQFSGCYQLHAPWEARREAAFEDAPRLLTPK